VKRFCADYNPCPHGKVKGSCAACKTACAAAPRAKRVKREPESSPEIKQDSEIKQEPFTIRGYFSFDDGDER
jgi:hypothetical protein|tara:strand:- start:4622 stop:4837 length:216 start_codon:yes stop_codon:yes gene_type:complete